jgi:hypothetical protein
MKKGLLVTYERTNKALMSVQNELYKIGLWNEGSLLTNVEVIWYPLAHLKMYDVEGIFFHGTTFFDRAMGFKTGKIYIPSVVIPNIIWQESHSLKDVIRHEYAHAFEHCYPDLISNSKEFEKIFGGNYYYYEPSQMEGEAYISNYAKTMPMEDFAETFMVFVRKQGVLPTKYSNVKLKRKWEFISKIIKQVN